MSIRPTLWDQDNRVKITIAFLPSLSGRLKWVYVTMGYHCWPSWKGLAELICLPTAPRMCNHKSLGKSPTRFKISHNEVE